MRTSTWNLLALAACSAALFVPTPGCGGKSSGEPTPSTPSSVVIGTSGGAVTSSDGHFAITLGKSSLASDTTFTITPANIAGAVGPAYVISPALSLSSPATLTLRYEGLVDDADASSIRIGSYVGGRWQALTGYALDASAHTIVASATSLGSFGGTQRAQVCVALSGNACASYDAHLRLVERLEQRRRLDVGRRRPAARGPARVPGDVRRREPVRRVPPGRPTRRATSRPTAPSPRRAATTRRSVLADGFGGGSCGGGGERVSSARSAVAQPATASRRHRGLRSGIDVSSASHEHRHWAASRRRVAIQTASSRRAVSGAALSTTGARARRAAAARPRPRP